MKMEFWRTKCSHRLIYLEFQKRVAHLIKNLITMLLLISIFFQFLSCREFKQDSNILSVNIQTIDLFDVKNDDIKKVLIERKTNQCLFFSTSVSQNGDFFLIFTGNYLYKISTKTLQILKKVNLKLEYSKERLISVISKNQNNFAFVYTELFSQPLNYLKTINIKFFDSDLKLIEEKSVYYPKGYSINYYEIYNYKTLFFNKIKNEIVINNGFNYIEYFINDTVTRTDELTRNKVCDIYRGEIYSINNSTLSLNNIEVINLKIMTEAPKIGEISIQNDVVYFVNDYCICKYNLQTRNLKKYQVVKASINDRFNEGLFAFNKNYLYLYYFQ